MNLLCPTTKPTSHRKHSSLISQAGEAKLMDQTRKFLKLYTILLEEPRNKVIGSLLEDMLECTKIKLFIAQLQTSQVL